MIFNVWHGQVRYNHQYNRWYYRAQRPRKLLQFKAVIPWYRLRYKREATEYRSDNRGNMEVIIPKHIEYMVNLGYPIFVDMPGLTVTLPQDKFSEVPRFPFLIWPDNPEYNRRVLEAISKSGGKLKWPTTGTIKLKC